MKTKLIALFVTVVLALVLTACGGAAPTAAPDGGGEGSSGSGDIVAKFDFNNAGAVDICQLFLSPVGTENWGPDQLQGNTIPAGGKFTLNNIPAGTYDAKWVGCDQTEGTLQVEIKNP